MGNTYGRWQQAAYHGCGERCSPSGVRCAEKLALDGSAPFAEKRIWNEEKAANQARDSTWTGCIALRFALQSVTHVPV